ncbi:helix-turn-helix transcriptional regulator [Pseudoalteromonas obscura]|uniref:AraC family transcriptional regulator n=1 Tax=Pseudoalteromonas obscura TaxID=3048491 RepID=A0ABT7EP42_9GAMM|nr:AraC family transcriptional regulator [Pseudoalteromonas sp. P94(2023)]MDK2596822.1 AraC family transcriptional regulator [Pseudoalteromonas sp. P94(2023)]
MKSTLKFFNYDSDTPSNCGQVLDIEFSSKSLHWPGVLLEKGSSPHFYPNNVYTPYFYFALGLEHDLHWNVKTAVDGMMALKTAPGDIWINPPESPFSHTIDEPCYFVILAIERDVFIESCTLSINDKALQFLNNYNVHDETIKGIMELFLLEAKSGGKNGYAYLKNLVSLLATHYIQNYSNFTDLQNARATASNFDQQQIDKVDIYIAYNINKPITVDEMADLLYCSKFYFLREFKKFMGITPYQYLMNKRLEEAKRRLSSSQKNDIASIGLDLGFNDQSHFTRSFKKQFGMTPGQFRNKTVKQ